MLISHEVPIALLEHSRSFNDIDYCLVHLLDDHPEYLKFFQDSLQMGRTVILDNSVFELEEAFDPDAFADKISILQPTEYIIPDVLDDGAKTADNVRKWVWDYDLPGKTIGVIQGKTVAEAIQCYREIAPIVDKVAVSFNCKFYETDPTIPKLEAWMTGRQAFMELLVWNDIVNIHQPFHLLGCSLPQEFLYYKKLEYGFIESVDTSNPIVHAINGIRYNDDGLQDKVSTKLIEYLNHTDFDMNLIQYNVNKFRSFT
jgi:hypothetical protein